MPAAAWYFASVSRNSAFTLSISTEALTPGGIPGGSNLYVIDARTGVAKLVVARPSPDMVMQLATTGGMNSAHFVANDGRTVLFSAPKDELVPGAGADNLYVWREGEGVELVSYLPESEGGGIFLGSAGIRDDAGTRDPLLYDDLLERIYVMSGDFGPIYARTGDSMELISGSQVTGSEGNPASGTLRAVAGDGRYAFFNTSSNTRLTDSTPSTGFPGTSQHLYRYDGETQDLAYIGTAQNNGTDLVQVSADGEAAVFVSRLQQSPPSSVNGLYTAYFWHSDSGVKKVAAFDSGAAMAAGQRSLRSLSANGRYFAFSDTSRTLSLSFGIDNRTENCTVAGMPSMCHMVYVYDYQEDELSCVSCNPDGSPPKFDSGDPRVVAPVRPQYLPGYVRMMQHQMRIVTEDGSVFFTTVDGLVPEDRNGMKDAYAWKDGQLRLISRARAGRSSRFLDASVDGKYVYFSTSDPIAPGDSGTSPDIYATFAGAGFVEESLAEEPVCGGPDCRSAARNVPAAPVIGSVDFVGAGNLEERAEPGRARVSVLVPRRVRAGRAVIRVRVPGAGKVTVTGSGLRRQAKRVSRAANYRVPRSRLRVAFVGRDGRRAVKTSRLVIRDSAASGFGRAASSRSRGGR